MKEIPNLGGTLEDWLEGQIRRYGDWFRERPVLVDVGAYHGEFSNRFVTGEKSPFRSAILFEPNPENFAELQRKLASDERFCLERLACGDQAGQGKLVCKGIGYTGSLLARRQEMPGIRNEYEVTIVTLDDYFAQKKPPGGVGLLKLDTQGNDLRALRGAVCLLARSRPWIVVEMLATPRFDGQAKPAEITEFLEGENYFLGAAMNEFYTDTGWLAWFDACFVPRELFSMDMNSNLQRPGAGQTPGKKAKWFFKGR
ncbi:MAG TPA: FkbM family methyltransferase [Verrucomicrobiae bacterium]|jgi:FkbM family methyltransferase|nr:FkbM family methyltransferase [Verrucomicrobiae bacterium]